MKAYRVYVVGADGRLQIGHAFGAPDDRTAVAKAQALAAKGQTLELWENGRLVGRVGKDGALDLTER